MLIRNSKIKERPQRFQDSTEQFAIIITFEDRVFDIVCEGSWDYMELFFVLELLTAYIDLRNRETVDNKPVHVINFNVKDNPEEAVIGAINVFNFLKKVCLHNYVFYFTTTN